MRMLRVFLGIPLILLMPLAGAYRVVAYQFRSFGGIGSGLLTWIGVLAGYPACVAAFSSYSPEAATGLLWSWLALVLAAWVQMFARWCSDKEPRDQSASHCWVGLWEPLFVLGLCIVAASVCGPGGCVFFAAGYAASTAQIGLTRLCRRLAAWTPEDTARLVAPLRAGALRINAAVLPYAQSGRARALQCASGVRTRSVAAWRHLRDRARQPAPPDGSYRPPSFSNRVMSYLVGHTIFSLLFGNIGIGAIFSVIGLVCAIPLYLLGWVVEPPGREREQATAIITQASGALEHQGEAAASWWDREQTEAMERLQPKWEEAERRLEEERQQIADEIERRKRRAVWDFFF